MVAYLNIFESVLGTKPELRMNIKFVARGNNGLDLTGLESTQSAILRLLFGPLATRPLFTTPYTDDVY
jgi:hypothetical protein